MEIWLIYALLSLFFAWVQNFIFKVCAVRNYNVSIVNKYTYFVSAIFWFVFFLIYFRDYPIWNLKITLFFAFLHSFFYSLSIFSRIKSMQNIDSVIFFPLYKTIWPILVTIISLLFFNETLTIKEVLWVIIGITVPLFLINNTENKIQKNLFLWVLFILVTAILTSISSSFNKEIMAWIYNFPLYIFASWVFWTIFSYITHYWNKKNNHKYNKNWVIKFSIFSWISW